jgi:hypothetical protein
MKLPQSLRNYTSFLGAVLAIISLIIIIFLFIITAIFHAGSSYLGIFIYIVLPVFLIIGLLLIPLGALITRRRRKKIPASEATSGWPLIDFNNPGVRNASLIFGIGTLVFIILSAIGSYEAFHYTESVEFCGKLCHKVMEPEYTAYQQSSHEKVKCVDCHVGEGANWYVKSKLSGLYQVYSVLFKKYPKPIPTPIRSLRPARETCEECHWTEKFYDRKMKMKRTFLADEENTEWDITLLMKTSATYSALGLQEGIHWHINPNVKIEYKTDSAGSIPWIKYSNLKTGESRIYQEPENKADNLTLSKSQTKTMDCMVCHNRPSHNYLIPQNFIDDAMISGEVPDNLPNFKVIAMQVLNVDYPDKDSAFSAIASQVNEFYSSMYEDLYKNNKTDINKAIAAIQSGYSRNIFPEMNVTWNKYPLHLGHLESNGCYRCHNDKHVSEDGHVISRDCKLCHNILAQGKPGEIEYASSFESLEFRHPVEIHDAWKVKFCSECHHQLY